MKPLLHLTTFPSFRIGQPKQAPQTSPNGRLKGLLHLNLRGNNLGKFNPADPPAVSIMSENCLKRFLLASFCFSSPMVAITLSSGSRN